MMVSGILYINMQLSILVICRVISWIAGAALSGPVALGNPTP